MEYKCLVTALLQIDPASRLPLGLIFTQPWVIKLQMKHKLGFQCSETEESSFRDTDSSIEFFHNNHFKQSVIKQ